MKVGIVGAGISGLSCARALAKSGHDCTLFEKSRSVGGRVSTRRKEGFIFDTGATSIATRGMSIESVLLNELDTTDLVSIEKRIDVHAGLRVSMGDPRRQTVRYTYREGINTFPKRLATGLDVRLNVSIDRVEAQGDHYRMHNEEFDAVVLTPPIPQTGLLLWGLREDRPLANARYRPCLSVLLGFDRPLPETPYFALLDPEQRHPLNWLSLESAKSPGRAPEGGSALVAQLGPRFSLEHYERSDSELVNTVVGFIDQLFGENLGVPRVSDVKRWKYSQPENVADFDRVNPVGTRLLIASDGLLGGQIESAFEVGLRCAQRLIV